MHLLVPLAVQPCVIYKRPQCPLPVVQLNVIQPVHRSNWVPESLDRLGRYYSQQRHEEHYYNVAYDRPRKPKQHSRRQQ